MKRILILLVIISLFAIGLCSCVPAEKKLERYENAMEKADSEQRIELVEKIAALDSEEGLNLLIKTLNQDKEEAVRVAALTQICQQSTGTIQITYALITASRDHNKKIKLMAIEKMADYHSVTSANELLKLIKDDDSAVRDVAVDSLKVMSDEPNVFEEIVLLVNDENETISNSAMRVLDYGIDHFPEKYDLLLKAAFPAEDLWQINNLTKAIFEKYIDNHDFYVHVINNVLSSDNHLNDISQRIIEKLYKTDKSVYEDLIQVFYSPEYNRDRESARKIGNSIFSLGIKHPEVLENAILEMESSDGEIADLMADALILQFPYSKRKTDLFIKAIVPEEGIDFIDGKSKDILMSYAYSGIADNRDEGMKVWKTKDQSQPIRNCLIESLKFSCENGDDSEKNKSKQLLDSLKSLDSEAAKLVWETMLDEYDKTALTDPKFPPYMMSTFMSIDGGKHTYTLFKDKYEELYEISKNKDLVEGYDKVIAIGYDRESEYGNPYYSYKYEKTNPISSVMRAYRPEHVRYVVRISTYDRLIGTYKGTNVKAKRREITVKIVDKSNGKVLSSEKFKGDFPPESISIYSTESVYIGRVDWNVIDKYIRDELQSIFYE